MKVGVNAITLSLPFGKASSPQEVINILTESKIGNLTIPMRSPTWGINPETITLNEVAEIAEMIPSGIKVSGIGGCWNNEYNMITDLTNARCACRKNDYLYSYYLKINL